MNMLRKIRWNVDKSQFQLMKETGVYFTTISKIERSWLTLPDEQENKLAVGLGVSERELFPDGDVNE